MKKWSHIVIVCLSVINQSVWSQDIQYARNIIDSLCDPSFHGRGYVNQGELKAADFIAEEFKSMGLESFGKSYFQSFDISVNTLPKRLEFEINGKLLAPGIDYQIAPSSPTTTGLFKPFLLDEKILLNWNKLLKRLRDEDGSFLIFDLEQSKDKETARIIQENLRKLQFSKEINLAGIIMLSDQKLTWHTSQSQVFRPFLIIESQHIDMPIKTIELNVDAKFYSRYQTQNVLGFIKGKSDSTVLLSAHYDHLGRMGANTYFPGANDNASGTALMLDLARHYSMTKPDYTIVFMAFGAEELGLLGSSYFVKNALFDLKKVKFMLNFDIAGTGDDGIQVVNGSMFKSEFNDLVQINNKQKLLPQVKIRGESCNSDHCPFYLSGVPAFFIYTLGGIGAYHDIHDKSETLPLTEYKDYFKLITQFIEGL